MGHRWWNDLKLTIKGYLVRNEIPDGMAQVWKAAPFDIRRQSTRIRKMRIALPLVLAGSTIMITVPVISGDYVSFTQGAGRIVGTTILIIALWRALVRASIHQASKVHGWATENLREPDMFLNHEADATAIGAPWVDIDARIASRMGRALKDRIGL